MLLDVISLLVALLGLVLLGGTPRLRAAAIAVGQAVHGLATAWRVDRYARFASLLALTVGLQWATGVASSGLSAVGRMLARIPDPESASCEALRAAALGPGTRTAEATTCPGTRRSFQRTKAGGVLCHRHGLTRP